MTINSKQKYIFFISSLTVLLMVLFPPVKVEHYVGIEVFQEAHAGYKFINNLNTEVESVIDRKKYPVSIFKIDIERFTVQFLGGSFITFMLILGFSGTNKRTSVRNTLSLDEDNNKDIAAYETSSPADKLIIKRDTKIRFNNFEVVGLSLLAFSLLFFLLLLKDVDASFTSTNFSFLLGYFILPFILFVVGIALLFAKK